jgi:hypothetical protein
MGLFATARKIVADTAYTMEVRALLKQGNDGRDMVAALNTAEYDAFILFCNAGREQGWTPLRTVLAMCAMGNSESGHDGSYQ